MRIALDVMGGDRGPEVILEGGYLAASEISDEVVLVGNQEIIEEFLAKNPLPNLSVYPAEEVIQMDEEPVSAVRRKKNSSMVKCFRLLKEKKVEAVVTAGNTGAAVASASIFLRKIKGVKRPTLAILLPTASDFTLLLDAGACVDAGEEELLQFGIIGSIYIRKMMEKENPKVGLLNIGEERTKGNRVVKSAYPLFEKSNLNFVGNIEGRDIFRGKADVVVCDGFVGNIVLKCSEGVAESMAMYIKEYLRKSAISREIEGSLEKVLGHFFQRVNYSNYGGAILLGVKGYCIITHGASPAEGIKNSILVACREVKKGINKEIEKEFVS
ncbi:MAG: phosphate acyltransferase PlsX [Caldiserica bacterium]|nr:phosphate acyltransferase PlsX [Caldisericota bacterium]